MEGNAKIAVGYARVSTEEQAKEGVSIDAQIEAIRSYCRREGIELIDIYKDEGISGTSMEFRPGIQDVMTAISSRRVTHVIAAALDRIGRDLEHLDAFRKLCDRRKVRLVTLNASTDYSTTTGRAMFGIEAVMSRMYRDQVADKTKAALRYVRDVQGKHLGHVPFGYARVQIGDGKGKLVINDGEQDILTDIRRMRDNGDSYWAISAWMNGRRIMPRTGRQWYPMSVRSLLLRTKYATAAEQTGELVQAATAATTPDAGGACATGGSWDRDGSDVGKQPVDAALPRPEAGGGA